jgi:hypothetical protein
MMGMLKQFVIWSLKSLDIVPLPLEFKCIFLNFNWYTHNFLNR